MTLFFYIIIGLITFFAFLHAWAKKSYDMNRTVVINSPKEEVYNFIRQLKKQALWMPWYHRDPKAVLKFNGVDGKCGAGFYWNGDGKVGEGLQKIIKTKEGKVFETKFLLVKPFKFLAHTYVGVKEIEAEKTKMVWGVRGHLPFPLTIFSLFYSVERLIGKDFELGLKNLKEILEKNN